ncbi:MAG: flagellar motor protein MotB [Planctomycetota bacterium]
MAEKNHNEEHVNMEAWVISYADMVTLLFALFVVLYALGEIKLSKLKEVAQSVAFAFNFQGTGKTREPGIFDAGRDGIGQVLEGAPLISAEKETIKTFLQETLPEAFQEQTGSSLDIVQTDDTISYKAKLSAYFAEGNYTSLRNNELARVLSELVSKTSSFTSDIRIRIKAPNVVISRNENGTYLRSMWICHLRLVYLHDFVTTANGVDHTRVTTEFQYQDGRIYPPGSPWARGWEDRATLEVGFSNSN